MSSEYQALIKSRAAAHRELGASSVWKTWKAAHDVLPASLLSVEDGPTPLTTPEALLDNSYHMAQCVLDAYVAVQQEEELREQLLLEWQRVHCTDSDIKLFARAELKKRSLQAISSASPSRIRPRTADEATTTSFDDGFPSRTMPHPATQRPSQASPSLLTSSPSLLPSLSQSRCSSSPDFSQLESAAVPPPHTLPPPTELLLREVNEVAPLPGQDQWNALYPGLAKLGVVGTLADGSCGQSTAHQALNITPWLRSPSRRASRTRRHPNSATPTREQLVSLNTKLSDWLSSVQGRLRWAELCEQTRHALPSVDLQSTEDALDEMKMLTTPVGLSWWMIFAEVHHVNVFLLHVFTSSLWEPDIGDPTASLLVQVQTQHACRLISRAGQLIHGKERENCMAVLCQQVSSSWADKTKKGTRNVAHYEVVVDDEGRSMWRTASPIVTEVLMPAVGVTEHT
jgi:hypothetical protein